MARVQSCADHATQVFMTYSIPCETWNKGTAQLLSLTELKSHLLQLYFIETINWWSRGGNQTTQENPKQGRKPEYPGKPQQGVSESATHSHLKIQDPTETQIHTPALVETACQESWQANHCTTCHPNFNENFRFMNKGTQHALPNKKSKCYAVISFLHLSSWKNRKVKYNCYVIHNTNIY